jgi:hypothetical protein
VSDPGGIALIDREQVNYTPVNDRC